MFKWIKHTGHNSKALPEGTERYTINVGDLWGGWAQSFPCENEPGKVYWKASYTVCGKDASGQGGGGMDRNAAMDFVEGCIADAMRQVWQAYIKPERRIFSAFWEKDEETGEFVQEELR